VVSVTYLGPARNREDLDRSRALRQQVFCDEQGVRPQAEFDGLDDEAVHLVGFDGEGLIATCRLLFAEDGVCRLGRMAVCGRARRTGAGRRLLAAAEQVARKRNAGEVLIHAQRQAEPFYAACGFAAEGETFEEEGIPHVLMRKSLRGD
jgi:predicted GNAT family N-acyltransferase